MITLGHKIRFLMSFALRVTPAVVLVLYFGSISDAEELTNVASCVTEHMEVGRKIIRFVMCMDLKLRA